MDILPALQNNLAMRAVGATTARKTFAGTIPKTHHYLAKLNLCSIGSGEKFLEWLDQSTDELFLLFPKENKNFDKKTGIPTKSIRPEWGHARKFLNIFLRDCAYNAIVCKKYNLSALESEFEVPLDEHVALQLKKFAEGPHGNVNIQIPSWQGIFALTPDTSKKFQLAARHDAGFKGIRPMDLDVIYWREIAR